MKNNENVYVAKNYVNTLISGTKLKWNQNCSILNILKILVNKNNENVYFEKNSIDTLISGTKLKRNQNCPILNIFKFLVNGS